MNMGHTVGNDHVITKAMDIRTDAPDECSNFVQFKPTKFSSSDTFMESSFSSSNVFTPSHDPNALIQSLTKAQIRRSKPPMRVPTNFVTMYDDDEDEDSDIAQIKTIGDISYGNGVDSSIAEIIKDDNLEYRSLLDESKDVSSYFIDPCEATLHPLDMSKSSPSKPILDYNFDDLEQYELPNRNNRLSSCNVHSSSSSISCDLLLPRSDDSSAVIHKKRLLKLPMRVPISEIAFDDKEYLNDDDDDEDPNDDDGDEEYMNGNSCLMASSATYGENTTQETSADVDSSHDKLPDCFLLSPESRDIFKPEGRHSALSIGKLNAREKASKTFFQDPVPQQHSSALKSSPFDIVNSSIVSSNLESSFKSSNSRTSWIQSSCRTQTRCMRPPLRIPIDKLIDDDDDDDDDDDGGGDGDVSLSGEEKDNLKPIIQPESPAAAQLCQKYQPSPGNTKFLQSKNFSNQNVASVPSNEVKIGNRIFIKHELLGKGGFSKVYRGSSRDIKDCAIKCIDLSEAEETTVTSYINEVSIMRQMQGCPGIIKLFDDFHDKQNKMMYLVMERGEMDLKSFYVNHSKENPEGVLSLIRFCWSQMLKAVNSLHDNGIVHWDLKPANFVIVKGALKVIDFGISKKVLPDHTSVTSDQIMGTYNYMSPEAFTNLSPDPEGSEIKIKVGTKSDVWSLGCILYNMVYGEAPFQKISNPLQKIIAITSHEIPYPFTPLGFTVVETLKKCLTREVKSRPTVKELLDDQFLSEW